MLSPEPKKNYMMLDLCVIYKCHMINKRVMSLLGGGCYQCNIICMLLEKDG